jgi:hypothetical protein
MRKVVSQKVPALPKGNLQSINPIPAQVSMGISTGAGIAWSGFPALAHESSAKVGLKRRTKWQANATKKSKEVFNQWPYDHFFPKMQAK